MNRKLNSTELSIVVPNEELRTQVTSLLNETPDTGKKGFLLIDAGHGRSLVYSGPLPAGTDKRVRELLRSGGQEKANVTTARNMKVQTDRWTTLLGVKATKTAYTPKAPKEEKPAETAAVETEVATH